MNRTYRQVAKMLGFDDAYIEATYGALADTIVPTEPVPSDSFVVGVDTNVPFDIDAVTRGAWEQAFYADSKTWLDELTDEEYDMLYERFHA